MADLDSTLEAIYGYDIGFDNGTGLVDADANATDFNTPMGPLALREELERLFLTPLGSCIDDPTYGIDIDYLIGTQLDPRVSIGLAR
jgi:phage baseplate assembly protein W